MTGFDPANPVGRSMTLEQAWLLRQLHGLAWAWAAHLGSAVDEGWPDPFAGGQDHLPSLVVRRALWVHETAVHGVPERTIAMAWLAGYRQQEWPEFDPDRVDAALQRLTWTILTGDRDQLLDMAAVDTLAVDRLDVHLPHPEAAAQFHRNATAVSRQINAVGDLLDASDSVWQQLWTVDGDQVAARYRDLGAATVRARWADYATPVIEVDAHGAVALLTQVRGHAAAWQQPGPDAAGAGSDVARVADPRADHLRTQAAISDALGDVAHHWPPATGAHPTAEPTPPTTDPGTEAEP